MKFLPGILFLLISFFSCSEKGQKKDILPEKEMREVMWDMMRADQYVAAFLLKDSTHTKRDESIRLYEAILHIHKITREKFKASFDYYSSQPDLFRPIIDSLAKRKIEPPHLRPTHPVRKDSLIKPFLRKLPK
jgi:hypothetical protein